MVSLSAEVRGHYKIEIITIIKSNACVDLHCIEYGQMCIFQIIIITFEVYVQGAIREGGMKEGQKEQGKKKKVLEGRQTERRTGRKKGRQKNEKDETQN